MKKIHTKWNSSYISPVAVTVEFQCPFSKYLLLIFLVSAIQTQDVQIEYRWEELLVLPELLFLLFLGLLTFMMAIDIL